MSGRVLILPLLLVVVVVDVASSLRRGPAVATESDRTLHIRKIPEVKGYNSHIYEVLMTPYLDKSMATGRAVAELRAPDGHALGEVEVRETRSGTLQLTGALTGLTPGAHLGLSVHESGDCRQLGPIFRPDQPADAPPSPAIPAGFLGSTLVSKDGHVTLNLKLGPQLALAGRRSMLARGVALYELEEPGRSPQSREALACGVLGRALPSPSEVAAARRRRHFQHVAVQLLPHTFISRN